MPFRPAPRMAAKARYGLQAASSERNSTRVELPFCGLYIGTRIRAARVLGAPHQDARALAPPPAPPRGALGRAPEPLVGVDPLVADRGDLRGVPQQTRDEGPGGLG